MEQEKKSGFDLNVLIGEAIARPAPTSCREIAELLSGLPPKSWIHKQAPTAEQERASELLKALSASPSTEELRYLAEVCCCKYHRIRSGAQSFPHLEKGREFYSAYYEATGSEEVRFLLDNFEAFGKLCERSIARRQRQDDLASVHDGRISTSRDPDSTEWKGGKP